jgi:hypothetical protein
MTPSGDGRLGLFGINRGGKPVPASTDGAGQPVVEPVGPSPRQPGGCPSARAATRTAGRNWPVSRRQAISGCARRCRRARPRGRPGQSWIGRAEPAPGRTRAVLAHNHKQTGSRSSPATGRGRSSIARRPRPGARTWSAWTHFSVAAKLRSLSAAVDTDGRHRDLRRRTTPDASGTPPQTSADRQQLDRLRHPRWVRDGLDRRRALGGGRHAGASSASTRAGTPGTAGRQPRAPQPGRPGPLCRRRPLADVGAAADPDGRVEVVGVDNVGAIWRSRQTSVGSGALRGLVPARRPAAPLDGQRPESASPPPLSDEDPPRKSRPRATH